MAIKSKCLEHFLFVDVKGAIFMKKFTTKMTNAVEPPAPASVWGKGVPGKGGATTNSSITENKIEKENV